MPLTVGLDERGARIEQRGGDRQRVEGAAHGEQIRGAAELAEKVPGAAALAPIGADLAHAAGEMERLTPCIAKRRALEAPPRGQRRPRQGHLEVELERLALL